MSTNHGSSSQILYTVNETVTINFAVDLLQDFDQYFGKAYFLNVFDGRSPIYSAYSSKTDYWSSNFKISTPTFRTVLLTIILFSSYSSEFQSNCEPYYTLIRPLLRRIIIEQNVLQVNYYGELIMNLIGHYRKN